MAITRTRKLWYAAMVVLGLVATVVYVRCLIGFANRREGKPIGARIEGDRMVLVDRLYDDDSSRARTTAIDLRGGGVRSRSFAACCEWPTPTPPICASVREVALTGIVLRLPPYSGEIGAAAYAETPAGTITIDAALFPLGFLVDARGGAPIVIGGDALLAHLTWSSGGRGKGELLSRVDGRGRPVWTVDIDSCEVATVEGDTIVIATGRPGRRAIAIDLATGAMRWRFSH